jgi:predicted phage terminase large subunit-like protein
LGSIPNSRIIVTSYGDDLVRKIGRKTRSVLRQDAYEAVFNATLRTDMKAVTEFGLTNGSEYLAAGILSGITGNRATGIVIDDPIKGREQADSKVVRDKTWDAYTDDVLTRLLPGGWLVLITTRWHEDDIAGRILPDKYQGESGMIACRDGNIWEVLCIQAKCERKDDPLGRKIGEYLWPEWFTVKHWREFESLPRTWSSLYQQRPAPIEGALFKPENIRIVSAIPAGRVTWVRGWDFGATVDGSATAGGKLGKHENGQFIIADMVLDRCVADVRDKMLLSVASQDGHNIRISIPQDPGQAGKSQVVYLTRMLSGYRVESSPETGDKTVRAEPFASQVNAGNVVMLRGNFNRPLIDEMRAFPFGTNDDQIDALSRAFHTLSAIGQSFFG